MNSFLADKRSRGFTLVEVMVAMAVVAVTLPGLLFLLFQQVDGTEHLRDRTIAQWVASNKLEEFRMIAVKQGNLPKDPVDGMTELADREWYWRVTATTTELPDFFRVEVQVGLDKDYRNTLQTMTTYLVPGVLNSAR